MSYSLWEQIQEHIGHDIQAVSYGIGVNAIECHDCNEIIFSGEQP